MKLNLLIIPILMTLIFSVIGCDSSTTPSNIQDKPKLSNGISRIYSGKPAAPVQLDYQILGEAQTGISLSISLKITPLVEASSIRINLDASPELFITDNQTTLEFSNLTTGQAVSHTIEVVPQIDGRHELRLNVHINSVRSRSGTRSFSIPLITGNTEQKSDSSGTAKTQPAPDDENLLIQKGTETRSVNQ